MMRLQDFNGREVKSIKLADGTEFSLSPPGQLIFMNGWIILEFAGQESARWNMTYLQFIEWAQDDNG